MYVCVCVCVIEFFGTLLMKKSTIIIHFTPQEVWKWHPLLLGIRSESSNTKILHYLGISLRTQKYNKKRSYNSINRTLYCTFVIYTSMMMTQEGSESSWEAVKDGKFISQFQWDIITSIQRFERVEIKDVYDI